MKETDGMIKTKNKGMKKVIEEIQIAAKLPQHVLIVGEQGTGRDTVAKMIHAKGPRSEEPFIKVDAGSLDEKAVKLRGSGVLYLDNLENMTKKMQAAMYSSMRRMGMNVKIISSATGKLGERIDANKFDYDLYLALAGYRIPLPALRQRKEDIADSARCMVRRFNKKFGKDTKLDGNAVSVLRQYVFEGNFTELEYIIGLAVLKNKTGVIKSNSLLSIIDMDNVIFACLAKGNPLSLKNETQRLEKSMIMNALRDTGSMNKAAVQLDVDVSTISRKCKAYGVHLIDRKSGEQIV